MTIELRPCLADAAALQVVLEGVPGARLHRVGAARVVEGHAGHQVGPELLGNLGPEKFIKVLAIMTNSTLPCRIYRDRQKKGGSRFEKLWSWFCLTLLLGLACSLHATWLGSAF